MHQVRFAPNPISTARRYPPKALRLKPSEAPKAPQAQGALAVLRARRCSGRALARAFWGSRLHRGNWGAQSEGVLKKACLGESFKDRLRPPMHQAASQTEPKRSTTRSWECPGRAAVVQVWGRGGRGGGWRRAGGGSASCTRRVYRALLVNACV